MSGKNILLLAGISGALAVGLGAFGAHGLEPILIQNGRLDSSFHVLGVILCIYPNAYAQEKSRKIHSSIFVS